MADKPRVLILTPDFPPAPGGIQLLVHRIASTMSALTPLVVAPGGKEAIEFDRRGSIAVRRVPETRVDHRATVAKVNLAAIAAARAFAPDVVLSAHIVTSPAAVSISKSLRIPVVQYLYANEVGSRPGLTRFALRRAAATIVISDHTTQLALRAGARPERLHLIPPGLDLPQRSPRPRRDRPTLITVARLEDRYKGHDTVVRALPLIRAQVPDVEWVVVGAGPRRVQLERLADIYGVRSSVNFRGRVDNAERDDWLERAHVFAMPSRVPGDGMGGEGFGIVYLEANWHGLPVIAGNAGGAVDAVADGETGLLVDANDPVAVADAATRLLRDEELRGRLGANGPAHAQKFAWPLITRQIEDLLLSMIAGR